MAKKTKRHPDDITAVDEEVLNFILWCYTEGYMPSYREIMDYFGWHSINAVSIHVIRLEAAGWLERRGLGKPLKLTKQSLGLVRH